MVRINRISRAVLASVMTGGRMARLTGPPVTAARAPTGQLATVLREIAAQLIAQLETGISKETDLPEIVAHARIVQRETAVRLSGP